MKTPPAWRCNYPDMADERSRERNASNKGCGPYERQAQYFIRRISGPPNTPPHSRVEWRNGCAGGGVVRSLTHTSLAVLSLSSHEAAPRPRPVFRPFATHSRRQYAADPLIDLASQGRHRGVWPQLSQNCREAERPWERKLAVDRYGETRAKETFVANRELRAAPCPLNESETSNGQKRK
jgi:hypothetical protein